VKERRIVEIEPVVDQDRQLVAIAFTGIKRILLKRVGQFVEPEFAAVPEDAAAKAQRADTEPEHGPGGSRHAAAVGGDAALARVFRRGVETPRNRGDFTIGDVARPDRLELRRIGAEPGEIPDSVERFGFSFRIKRISVHGTLPY